MKNLSKIVLIILVLFCALLLSVRADALEGGINESYTVTDSAEGYELYSNTEGTEPIFKADKLGKIIDFIKDRSVAGDICLSDIEAAEEVCFDVGSYTISGSIKINESFGIVIDGADMKFSGLKISMQSGSVRVKKGRLSITESDIFSESHALNLDYSSDAAVSVISGNISSFAEGAINIKHGTARVMGGKIESTGGAAIVNSSTLIMLKNPEIIGEDFDILTSTPPILSEASSYYTGKVKIKYDSDFEKGKVFIVAYGASLESEGQIELYDRLGRERSVKYYESFSGVNERNFLTAYLPYEIKIEMQEKTETQYYLEGEKIVLPEPEKRTGYEFFGWRVGKEDGELYEPTLPLESDIVLYPSYTLNAPTFLFSSLSFVYDTEEHYLSLSELSHPLISEGIMSYRWYKNGKELSIYGDKIALKNVEDSGKYKCLFTFSHKSSSVTVETPEISVEISKCVIDVPNIPFVYYNGEVRSPELYSLSLYEVERVSASDAGVYPVKIKLTDPANYSFKGTENEEISVDFIIKKAENRWLEPPTLRDVYSWENISPLATALFGDIEYLFSETEDGEYTAAVPKEIGTYYMKGVVSETDNYTGLLSTPVKFSVLADSVESLHIVKKSDICDYVAFDTFKADGMEIVARYVSGKEEKLSGSDIEIEYHNGKTLLFGDKTVILKYGGKTVLHSISVSKAEYDVSSITFGELAFEYSGEYKSPTFLGTLPIGLDGIPLRAVISGGGKGVGSYGVTLEFFSDSTNYRIPTSLEAIMTITPKTVEIFWESTSFVYDGAAKCPSAYYFDISGKKVVLEVSGARSYAGEYEALAKMSGENYRADNTTAKFLISRADYDLSSLCWTSSSLVYNGSEQSVVLSGLPLGVSVIGYSDNRATETGKYIANVTLSYDSNNYNPPVVEPLEWTIIPAEYDMSGVSFPDAVYEYDGAEHFPCISGTLPKGADGSVPSYEFSGGVTDVSEGRVRIIISFVSGSKNYNAPKEAVCYIEITPKPIIVEWENFSFVYTSALFSPSASAAECDVIVLGAESEAGKHTATAKSLDSNYTVTNFECDYEILKTENQWSTAPGIDGIYSSGTLAPRGESSFGETYYLFSSDKSNTVDTPTSAGIYYFKAKSDGDNNHFPIESEWIEFEIVAVVPTDFFVELSKSEFLTLEQLSKADFEAFVKNNDGSLSPVPYEYIAIVYQNGESLAFSDSSVKFSYLDFSAQADVSVKKRDYDLSAVFWQGTRGVYDGKEKNAEIIGLPEGVSVISYTGNGNINAGLYIVSAVLSYDSENYNQPAVEDVIMTIEKQTVAVKDIPKAEYNTEALLPEIEPSELYSYEAAENVNAGIYSVKFVLTDNENYVFENGKDTLYKDFEITKRKLTVRIFDVEIYLFGKESDMGYEIIEGELLSGDSLSCSYDIIEDKIFASFDSQNYEIEVIGGKVTESKRLSPEDTEKFILIVIIIILFIVATVVIITNRKRLRAFYSRVFSRGEEFIPTMPIIAQTEQKRTLEPENEEQNTESSKEEILPDICDAEKTDTEENTESKKEPDASEENELIDEATSTAIDVSYADSVITDSLARDLIRRDGDIETEGTKKGIINVDTLSRSFLSGERVDINLLKEKSLIPYDTGYIKVLARGIIDKPLTVYANDFSLSAVKMIALAGGKSIKANTVTKGKSRAKGNFNKRT